LIAQASIDYASRTLPEIIQNDKIVKAVVIGKDLDGAKYARADRVSKFMSYQLMEQSSDWEEGTDALLHILPILGTVFKKTYYDETEKRNCSELCLPEKIVVNYKTSSIESARRVTHCISLKDNDIVERQRRGLFCECDLVELTGTDPDDEDASIEFLEQHCFLDLDEDGYKEPYIVTVHKESGKVLRIVNRFKKIEKNADGKVLSISAEHYFTDYHFIKSPDGGFYSMGFGSLLLPINKAINSLINQLIDSGTLNNMQGGLIGRGLRLKNGQIQFQMGKWQVLDAANGDDIRKSVFPWPTKEPSGTLFSLLSLLMQVGRDLSSTTDVLSGKQPAQNVASSTISQLVEQGTKVFVAINKRVYRSLKKEYRKLYRLNARYLSQSDYENVLDDDAADVKKDFDMSGMDIMPVADPAVSTESQRMYRAGALQQLRTADPREVDKMFLEAMQLDVETIERLLPKQDPNAAPPPEVQKLIAETQRLQAEVAKISAEATLAAEQNMMEKLKLQQFVKESDSRIEEAVARVWKMQQDAVHNMQKTQIVSAKMQSEQELKGVALAHRVDNDQASNLIKAQQVLAANTLNDVKAQSKTNDGSAE
jgi:chaperonin GroES